MITARRLIAGSIFVLLLIAGWSFAHNHTTPVTISYWLGEWGDVPLWLALICAFAAGAAVTALFAGFELARSSLVARRYRRVIAGLEEEVHQLRNLPLAAEGAEPSGRPAAESGNGGRDDIP